MGKNFEFIRHRNYVLIHVYIKIDLNKSMLREFKSFVFLIILTGKIPLAVDVGVQHLLMLF